MNLSPNVHKLTIGIALVTLFFTFFGKFLPLGEELKIAIVGFIGALGAFIKTFQVPPEKKSTGGPPSTGVTRIIGGISLLLCLSGCASLRDPKAPTFDLVETVSRQVGNILAFVEPLMPPGDVKLAAMKAAQAQKDFERFFALARPVLEQIAKSGEEVPQEVADQVVTGEAAAASVQNFARAISDRNQDGSPKTP
jgi:hypothetical protein